MNMVLPEWVENQKKQGFEIKKIGNGYYMYKRRSRWDKEKKKAVKVTGEYIGVVTPDGIIPRKQRLDEKTPVFSKEYGAIAFIDFIASDILETLSKHFGTSFAQQIWAVSTSRLISPCPFRRVGDHYHTSWMSEILPDLPLSKSSITRLIDHVGNNRAKCAAFMRDMLEPAPYLLIDGSKVTSKSEGMLRALPGHNSNNKFPSQINQIHIATVSKSGYSMPGFYRNVSGNTPDVSAFELTLEDAGVEEGIVLGDNGFASTANFEELEDSELNLKYIVPLKRNTKEVDLNTMEFEEYFSYHNRGISAHMDDMDGYRIYTFRDAYMYAKEFSDKISRTEKANATAMRKRNFDPEKDFHDISEKTKECEKKFGTIVLRTNICDKPAPYIFQTYKIRWNIEQLFNTLRNTCEQDASYMRDDAGFEAWSFFGHITISIACRILAKLKELELLKQWSLEALLDHLARIHVVKINGQWKIAETTKKTRELVAKLGVNLELNKHDT
jgi:transposase